MNLILTADDFGRSREINAAVVRAHREGVLTAASLMVAGEAFAEAVAIARSTPTLAVGLHVVLVDGPAVLPAERIPLLVDGRGRFPDAPAGLGMRYFFDPRARRQMQDELEAQFSRFAATGLPLAHIDGHQHLHVHPAVFPIVVELAKRYGAAGVRVPCDELRFALRHDRSRPATKVLWATAFGLLGVRARRRVRGGALATTQRVYGLMQTGRMDEAYVLALLRHIDADAAEVYFHPTVGERTDALGPNPDELHALLSPAVRQAIDERGFRLCAYPDLPRDHGQE